MPDGHTMALFGVASLALLAVPGPAVIYLITRSAHQGRSAGLLSLLGVETGTFLYALAAAAGLTALIAASQIGFTILTYAGAAYLIFLGVQAIRRRAQAVAPRPRAPTRLYLDGLLVQLLNPKIAIFFLAFLPQFVDGATGPAWAQILLLGTVFTVLALLSDGLYVLLAGEVGRRLLGGARARRRLGVISGGIYIALGVGAAFSGTRPTPT